MTTIPLMIPEVMMPLTQIAVRTTVETPIPHTMTVPPATMPMRTILTMTTIPLTRSLIQPTTDQTLLMMTAVPAIPR